MQPFKRPLFICSAIEQCRETTNCCPHKQPHIMDERCVPKECRYAPGVDDIDCVAYPLEKPSVPVAPVKTVEQEPKETIKYVPGPVTKDTLELIKRNEQPIPARDKELSDKHDDSLIPDLIAETVTQETSIKEAVKKQQKKGGRKKA